MDLHTQDSHLEVVVLVYRKDHDRKVVVEEVVAHIRHLVVLVAVGGSFLHSHGHSHHILFFLALASVRAGNLSENKLLEGDLDGHKDLPYQGARSGVEEYEIGTLHLGVDVLPGSVNRAV
jgi:hypothetical protein